MEAVVLLLDVSPLMHGFLSELEMVCSMLVQKKLIFGKRDEVGVVLFGTTDTDNELEKEIGGYEHVVVLQRVKVVDQDVLENLHGLPRGTAPGDFLDAIVVGLDMLIKKFGSTNKGKQRLCLITSAQYPVKEPFEGTKEDQVNAISMQLRAHGVKLECIITSGWEQNKASGPGIFQDNLQLLNLFSKKAVSRVVHVESATSLLGALRTRNISPVTIFRGDMELSSKMNVKVWVYKKTSEERLPTLKKYSDKAPPTDKFATREIKLDVEYKDTLDPSKIVPPEQRIKGYRYGSQLIPISADAWEAVRLKPEKGVKLLGFTDASYILRHYYMKDVYVFTPEPGNKKAAVAVSALARAMKEMNKCAILRCVWRKNQGNVVIGALTPNISSLDNVPDSFYFNVLPFAEDVRDFKFLPFGSFPSAFQPSSKQQEAADNIVELLDLAPLGREEKLKPDFTPNPILERFYNFLEIKSQQPDADVPPLNHCLKRIVEPDALLLSQNVSKIDNFRSLFELKENPKRMKLSRNLKGEDKLSLTDKSEISNIDSTSVKVEKIGDSQPVKDFETMLSRRDSPDWVPYAIRNMKNYISNVLENSFKGDTYPRAIKCLEALRRGCIVEQEPNEFNQFLRSLYSRWNETGLKNFFGLLAAGNISLISKSESVDSDATEEEVRNFPAKLELSSQ